MGNIKLSFMLVIVLIQLCANIMLAQTDANYFLKRVLITNDDGINDPKMIALANALSKTVETYVIAPNEDKSGTTHLLSVYSRHILKVKNQASSANLKLYSVEGFPADCVFLALNGIMKDKLPDLVISGINDGPNLGDDWIASGTIGAARMAAHWGIPAIAVSGFKGDNKEDLAKKIEWIISFAQSKIVNQLKKGQYLTVSIPQIPIEQIKGIKVSARGGSNLNFEMRKIDQNGDDEVWTIMPPVPVTNFLPETDAESYYLGYIVIVPMAADEVNYNLLSKIKESSDLIPSLNK